MISTPNTAVSATAAAPPAPHDPQRIVLGLLMAIGKNNPDTLRPRLQSMRDAGMDINSIRQNAWPEQWGALRPTQPGKSPRNMTLLQEAVMASSARGASGSVNPDTRANRDVRVIKLLLEFGADVDARDLGADTALFHAAYANHAGACTALVAAGARVDLRNKANLCPLHAAAHNDCPDACLALIEAGADPLAQNTAGHTPADHAIEVARRKKKDRSKIPESAGVLRAAEMQAQLALAMRPKKKRSAPSPAPARPRRPSL